MAAYIYHVEVAQADVYDDAYVEPFQIRLNNKTRIETLKEIIIEKSKETFLGPITTPAENLHLVYEGKLLTNNTRLADYETDPRIRWPVPYKGTIFIINRPILASTLKAEHIYMS